MKHSIFTLAALLSAAGVVLGQSLTASITPKQALVTVIVASKTYDGTTAATVTTCTVQGILAGDVVVPSCTATFTTKQAGTAKAWTATITWSGTDVGNYSLPTSANGTADILRKPLTLQLVANSKVYNALLDASLNPTAGLNGVVAPDVVCVDTSGLTAAFADKNVGVNKPVTVTGTAALGCADAGNYTLGGTPPPPSPPPTGGLLSASDITYVGAFKVPTQYPDPENSFNDSRSMGYDAASGRLLLTMAAGGSAPKIAQISVPQPINSGSLAALNTATTVAPFTEVTGGHWQDIDAAHSGGPIKGILSDASGNLFVSVMLNYDGNSEQIVSHIKTGTNFASLPAIIGPVEIATGLTTTGRAGYVSGYMSWIPAPWQAALGGTAFTGNGCLSINGRTNWGTGVSAFTPTSIGSVTPPIPATTLLRYTAAHPTLGVSDAQGSPYYNDSCEGWGNTGGIAGVVLPEGTNTVLFLITHGEHRCYGEATGDPALDGQQVPGEAPGVVYCYDTELGGKGNHSNNWTTRFLAYQASDLAAVKAGTKNPWEPIPYAYWDITDPYTTSTSHHYAPAMAYDASRDWLFILKYDQDAPRPLIHVWHVTRKL